MTKISLVSSIKSTCKYLPSFFHLMISSRCKVSGARGGGGGRRQGERKGELNRSDKVGGGGYRD